MSDKILTIDFNIEASAWPKEFRDLLDDLGFRSAKRSTDEFPIWYVLRGDGYSIWLSEARLADSTRNPPRWLIRLESLSELSSNGAKCWNELVHALTQFFDSKYLTLLSR